MSRISLLHSHSLHNHLLGGFPVAVTMCYETFIYPLRSLSATLHGLGIVISGNLEDILTKKKFFLRYTTPTLADASLRYIREFIYFQAFLGPVPRAYETLNRGLCWSY